MSVWLYVALALGTAALTLLALDQLALRLHWRVGRWGSLLSARRSRVGEGCLRCKTDYRYVRAHPTPYTGTTKEDARVVIPLCARCWYEANVEERLIYYGQLLNLWRADGSVPPDWEETRVAIYAAVKAGL